MASLPRYYLHARHDLVDEPAVYLVGEVDVSLRGLLYPEEIDQISHWQAKIGMALPVAERDPDG